MAEGVKRKPRRSVATWSWASVNGTIAHLLRRKEDPVLKFHVFNSAPTGSLTSWTRAEPLTADLEVQALRTINDLVHNATLRLSGALQSLSSNVSKVLYYTIETPPTDEIHCLPVLKLVNDRPGSSVPAPILGLLVRAMPTACETKDGWSQYTRVGCFWTATDAHLENGLSDRGRQRLELV